MPSAQLTLNLEFREAQKLVKIMQKTRGKGLGSVFGWVALRREQHRLTPSIIGDLDWQ
jgi:hypothetical protein